MTRTLVAAAMCLAWYAFADVGLSKVNEVNFLAIGPAGFKINGQTTAMEVKAEGEAVVLRVPLDSVDTGIELRNKHMKEKYLDTKSFPFAELKVAKTLLKEGTGQKGTGTFTVHGQAKEVQVTYDVAKSGEGLEVKGSFDINIKQHGIDVPNYMGITVKPEVKVVAAFQVKP
jgi:polyisoprenoid-binding protein YceI